MPHNNKDKLLYEDINIKKHIGFTGEYYGNVSNI